MELVPFKDASKTWNEAIENLPGAQVLQSYQWGLVKSKFGWRPHLLQWRNPRNNALKAAALVLERTMPLRGLGFNLGVMYVPRGPLLDWADKELGSQVMDDLQRFARQRRAIFLKMDPELPLGFGIPGEAGEQSNPIGLSIQTGLINRGWNFSDEQIQFRNTVLINLDETEEDLLMRMKSKTRYNIRLAERRGVTTRVGGRKDIPLLYKMYAHTSIRDNFVIRSQAYYQAVWQTFFDAKLAEPLIAEVEGQPVGGAVIFRFGKRAWYMHGMSLDEHREKMFTYRLQWEAMVQAKAAGCTIYDMWGAPDKFDDNDPMWSVYRFKDGFGGQVVRTLGAWDFPVRPLAYRLYHKALPRILNLMRGRGKSDTKRKMSA